MTDDNGKLGICQNLQYNFMKYTFPSFCLLSFDVYIFLEINLEDEIVTSIVEKYLSFTIKKFYTAFDKFLGQAQRLIRHKIINVRLFLVKSVQIKPCLLINLLDTWHKIFTIKSSQNISTIFTA